MLKIKEAKGSKVATTVFMFAFFLTNLLKQRCKTAPLAANEKLSPATERLAV